MSVASDLGQDLEKVRRHIRILVDLSRLAGERSDLEGFLDHLVVHVARAVEIDHVKVLRYRPDTSDLLVAAGIGWKDGIVRTATLSADISTAPGRALRTAEPVCIEKFSEQKEFLHTDFLKQHGIVSLVNVPVVVSSASWGVLEVDSTTPRDFSHDTVEFLSAAAALISIFIQGNEPEPDEASKLAAAAIQAQNREILLREMQHRVKNNFQLIQASIALQKRRDSSGESHRALDHVASRINAISLAHDQLAPRQDGQVVKLSHYLRALCLSLKQQVEDIEIDVELDEIELSIDRAVPLGLILNEAAMNSIKHAFGSEGGRISVRLAGGIGYGEARLMVSDNGRGMPKKPPAGGSGMRLINSLARQIGGTLEQVTSGDGTTTSLTFPVVA